jgi:hypothetical protein
VSTQREAHEHMSGARVPRGARQLLSTRRTRTAVGVGQQGRRRGGVRDARLAPLAYRRCLPRAGEPVLLNSALAVPLPRHVAAPEAARELLACSCRPDGGHGRPRRGVGRPSSRCASSEAPGEDAAQLVQGRLGGAAACPTSDRGRAGTDLAMQLKRRARCMLPEPARPIADARRDSTQGACLRSHGHHARERAGGVCGGVPVAVATRDSTNRRQVVEAATLRTSRDGMRQTGIAQSTNFQSQDSRPWTSIEDKDKISSS